MQLDPCILICEALVPYDPLRITRLAPDPHFLFKHSPIGNLLTQAWATQDTQLNRHCGFYASLN